MARQEAPLSEQIDIAVDLGAVVAPLPDIITFRQFAENPPTPPPQIIEGVLLQGCKMILGGTSKSNKSWCLLDLALSVASGQPWWGRTCAKLPVVYINFELHGWAMAQRLNALCAARPECQGTGDTFHLWNLRGHNADLTLLRPKLEEQLARPEDVLKVDADEDGIGGDDAADGLRYLVATNPRVVYVTKLTGY